MLTWWPIIDKYGLLRTMKQKGGGGGGGWSTVVLVAPPKLLLFCEILSTEDQGNSLPGWGGGGREVLPKSVLEESHISLSDRKNKEAWEQHCPFLPFTITCARKNSWWHVPKWSRHKWKQEDRSTGLPGQAESPETLSLMPGPYYETVPRRSPGREDWPQADWIYEHIVTI